MGVDYYNHPGAFLLQNQKQIESLASGQHPLKHLFSVLGRFFYIWVPAMIIGAMASKWVTAHTLPQYLASTTLLVIENESSSLLQALPDRGGGLSTLLKPTDQAQQFRDIAESRTIAEAVSLKLDLRQNKKFIQGLEPSQISSEPLFNLNLMEMTKIRLTPTGANILECQAPDPQVAADICNTWADVSLAFFRSMAEKNFKVLQDMYTQKKVELLKQQAALQKLEQKHKLPVLEEQLTAQLRQSFADKENLVRLRRQLAEATARAANSSEPGEVAEATASIHSIRQEINDLRLRITATEQFLNRMPKEKQAVFSLEKDIQFIASNIQSMEMRLDALKTRMGEGQDRIRVMDPAIPPLAPFVPKPKEWLIMGLLAGLFSGVLAAMVLDICIPRDH